jgi:hypothetical protein
VGLKLNVGQHISPIYDFLLYSSVKTFPVWLGYKKRSNLAISMLSGTGLDACLLQLYATNSRAQAVSGIILK